MVCLAFVYFRMRRDRYGGPPTTHGTPSFSNPIYNTTIDESIYDDEIDSKNETSVYQDLYYREAYEEECSTESNTITNIDEDYLDVHPDEENMNSFTTSASTDF